jgi:hypothetical protein
MKGAPPPSGISPAILAYSRRIAASAASACLPPCPSRRPSKKTSPREPCRSRTIFHGASCSGESSRSTRSALAARVLFASSLSSRPRTPSRRSWPAWVCPPRHPNPIRQDLLRLNRLNRGTAQSTTVRRVRDSPIRTRETRQDPPQRAARTPSGPCRCGPSGFSDPRKPYLK